MPDETSVRRETIVVPQSIEQQTLAVLQQIEGMLVRIYDVLLDKRDEKKQPKGKK